MWPVLAVCFAPARSLRWLVVLARLLGLVAGRLRRSGAGLRCGADVDELCSARSPGCAPMPGVMGPLDIARAEARSLGVGRRAPELLLLRQSRVTEDHSPKPRSASQRHCRQTKLHRYLSSPNAARRIRSDCRADPSATPARQAAPVRVSDAPEPRRLPPRPAIEFSVMLS